VEKGKKINLRVDFMKIIRIFGGNLWSCVRKGQTKDEFSRAFHLWHDIEYLETFFEEHRKDLQHGYYRLGSVEEAVWATLEEAKEMEKRLLELCKNTSAGLCPNLDHYFIPLSNHEYRDRPLSKRKGKGHKRQSWLRIYAIKIEEGCYLVVGSAIKLSRTMEERPHTLEELRQLDLVRDYLKAHDIEDKDGFMELVI
jgi:hypothetical protein